MIEVCAHVGGRPGYATLMARAIWSGQLGFGLVNVPVGLYSATRQQDVSFHQFERGTHKRVRNKRVAENTDRLVDYDDIVKGYEVDDGDHVMLTQEELESAAPEKSRALTITDFVEVADIDPIFYEKTYYLGPRNAEAEPAYTLLYHAMRKAGLAGVGSFVMRNKEYLAVVRPAMGVLVLETLYFADEVRAPEEVLEHVPDMGGPEQRELDTAVDLIRHLTTDWEPERYHDTYRERVLEMIRQKAAGEKVEVREPASASEENVVDLMSVLQRSIEQAKGGKGGRAGAAKSERGDRRKAGARRGRGERKGDTGTGRDATRERSPTRTSTRSARNGRRTGQGSRRGTRGDELDRLTKDELYRKAGELGVAGRSKMNRDQLREAVLEAS